MLWAAGSGAVRDRVSLPDGRSKMPAVTRLLDSQETAKWVGLKAKDPEETGQVLIFHESEWTSWLAGLAGLKEKIRMPRSSGRGALRKRTKWSLPSGEEAARMPQQGQTPLASVCRVRSGAKEAPLSSELAMTTLRTVGVFSSPLACQRT